MAEAVLSLGEIPAERVHAVDQARRDDVVRVCLDVRDELGVPPHGLGERDDRVHLGVVANRAVEPFDGGVDVLDDAHRADAPVVAHLVRHVDKGADRDGQQDDDRHWFTPQRV